MPTTQILLWNLAAIAGICFVLWGISLVRRDASIADLFWGAGFVILAWMTLANSSGRAPKALIVAGLVTVWGLRLAGYLTWRNWGKEEDYRYAEMREKHGKLFPLVSLVTVFWLQGLLMWVVSLPIQVGIAEAETWHFVASMGAVLWLVGLLFETLGDYQLARFKSKPENKGQVMDRGLWRYTRHPNYFGDFLVWWGLYLVSARPESFWWTIVGPALMSFLLIRVSGVRLLESSLSDRVDGYRDYVRNTSAFFPLPPKS